MDQGFPQIDSSAEVQRTATGYWCGAFGVSTVVHFCAMLLLASLWMQPKGSSRVTIVDSRWSTQRPTTQFERVEQIQQIATRLETEVGGAQTSPLMLESQQNRPVPVGAPSTQVSVPADWLGGGWTDGDLAEEAGAASGRFGEAATIGNGSGTGSGDGDGAGGGFFGARAEGRRFVYVVDCSRSMNHPHASEAKTRFRRLKIELVRSIASMDADMQFYIIFFNDRTLPMPARSLQPAVPDKQKRYLHWAAKIRADGDTDPRAALRFALRLSPDVIYFLTDGDFQRPIQRDLAKLRQDRVAIHTFAFGNTAAEGMLKSIALANGGEYHFVP